MSIVSIKNLNFGYNDELVLKDCNFELQEGDFTLILGGNGSGKSTLLKLMLGELSPQSGSIKILDKNIKDYSSYKDIGYVPQINVVNKIAFPITCLELVTLNLYEDFGFIRIPRKRHYQKAKELMEKMSLGEYINRPVNELSGGLQQRTMICRAMINNPKLLILDEPTAGVDKQNKEKFIQTISELNENLNISIIMVTHELKEVEDFANITNKYQIKDGRLTLC